MQQLCHPMGFPWSLQTDFTMGVKLTLGMGGQPTPPSSTTLVTGVGSSAEPLPTDNPCCPKPPRLLLPPALHPAVPQGTISPGSAPGTVCLVHL